MNNIINSRYGKQTLPVLFSATASASMKGNTHANPGKGGRRGMGSTATIYRSGITAPCAIGRIGKSGRDGHQDRHDSQRVFQQVFHLTAYAGQAAGITHDRARNQDYFQTRLQ